MNRNWQTHGIKRNVVSYLKLLGWCYRQIGQLDKWNKRSDIVAMWFPRCVCVCVCVCVYACICSVMSESLWSHSRANCIVNIHLPVCFSFVPFMKSMLVTQSFLTLWKPMVSSLSGRSVHRILKTRILERGCRFLLQGSSWPRDWSHIFCISCIGS